MGFPGIAFNSHIMDQTAAYRAADTEESGTEYEGRWALRLSKETEDEYYERQEEQGRQLRMYAQQAQSSYPYVSNSAQNAAQNTSGNTGLFGQAGSALQGLFK